MTNIDEQLFKVNKNSPIPLYKQVACGISDLITKGIISKGDKLPSLNEISNNYQISKSTAEAAYLELSNQKLIIKSRGKGHFVFSDEW